MSVVAGRRQIGTSCSGIETAADVGLRFSYIWIIGAFTKFRFDSVGKDNGFDLSSDGFVVEDDFSVGRDHFRWELAVHIVSIFTKFFLSVGESKDGRVDGGIPSGGPFATRFDFSNRLGTSKTNFSWSHASNIFFDWRNMVEGAEDVVETARFSLDNVFPFDGRESSGWLWAMIIQF